MATSQLYNGDGSTTTFTFTPPYINTTDIKAEIGGVATTAFSVSGTTITFNAAPAAGSNNVKIFRDTNNTTIEANFQSGSALRAVDFNNNFTQLLYVTQESTDTSDEANTDAAVAVATANIASANATTAVNTANTASTNASNAVTTANTASTNATAAVNTANTASTNATAAVNTANTASTNASSAVTTANSATTSANSAVTTANSAVTTANTASTNASSAVTTANSANATANAAASTVASAVFYTPVANFASFPSSPSNQDRIEVADSTGLQSQSIVAGIPSGFTGSSDLTMRLEYNSSTSKWDFKQYFAEDPEARYMPKQGGTMTGLLTLSGAPTANLHAATKAYVDSANTSQNSTISTNTSNISTNTSNISSNTTAIGTKLALAGGTLTGALTLSGNPTTDAHAATKAYVDTEVAAVVDTAPAALNTLNELAAALGDDANFSTTVSNNIGTKLPLAGGTLTGGLVGTTADFSGSVDAGGGVLVDGLTGTQNAIRVETGGSEKFTVKADGSTYFVGNVNLYANLDLQDNDKILLGTGDDFQFYHNGTNNYIDANGDLYIRVNNGTETALYATANGKTQLNYDNNQKLVTKSDGVDITGELQCDTLDVDGNSDITGTLTLNGQLNNSGTGGNRGARLGNIKVGYGAHYNSIHADDGTSNLYLGYTGSGGVNFNYNDQGTVTVGSASHTVWHAGNDGSGSGLDADLLDGVQGSSYLRSDAADTASGDITFSGGAGAATIAANSDIRFASGSWTGDTNAKIQYHGNILYIQYPSYLYLRDSNGDDHFKIDTSGNIYGINDITCGEIEFSGEIKGDDGDYIKLGTSNDLQLVHNGTNSYIDNFTGHLNITNYANDKDIKLETDDGSNNTTKYILCDGLNGNVYLYHYGTWKLRTTSSGVDISGSLTATGNVTAYSDITLKDNIETIPDALNKVSQIRGVTFDRSDLEDAPRQTGVIAQEVEKVLPEVVSETEDGLKTVAYGNIVGLLIESIKELKSEVDELKAKLEAK